MKMIVYNNLSQCGGKRMVYFRSTDIEQMNYHRLLWSVPDEMLYFIAKGYKITIVDKSSNRGKIERIFIPVLNDFLNTGISCLSYFAMSPHLMAHLQKAVRALKEDTQLGTKYNFWWKKFVQEGLVAGDIKITAKTIKVNKERPII